MLLDIKMKKTNCVRVWNGSSLNSPKELDILTDHIHSILKREAQLLPLVCCRGTVIMFWQF